MNNTLAMPIALPSGSLETYIQGVNRIPMVTAEEERELAVRYRDENDLEAARQLVLAWGGRIGVESESGRGATFWFTIPVSAG